LLIPARQSQVLTLIRRNGPLSRRELHDRTRLRPNTIGQITGVMLDEGLLREGQPQSDGRGRPRQPLEIDASRRRVVGLSFEPGKVSLCRLNLHGRREGAIVERQVRQGAQMIEIGAKLVADACDRQTLAIGVAATGFIDPDSRSILTSSATMRHSPTPLDPIYAAAGKCPVLLENDMHARAFHWLLSQNQNPGEDVLLIELRDGAVGAALLIDGHPNRGCIIAGNELGHTRLPVETEMCYCGQVGCLERICSSDFLARLSGSPNANLYERLSRFYPGDKIVEEIAGHLAMGIGNAINFIRPNRVLLTGNVTEALPFSNELLSRIRKFLLAPLVDRVRIDIWDAQAIPMPEAAGWVALAAIYRGNSRIPGANHQII